MKENSNIIKCFFEEKSGQLYKSLKDAKAAGQGAKVYRSWIDGDRTENELVYAYGESVCTIKRADEILSEKWETKPVMTEPEKKKEPLSFLDFEVNTLYILSAALELMVRDVEDILRKKNLSFKQEKKREFLALCWDVEDIYRRFGKLEDDIINACGEDNLVATRYDNYRFDANELVRLILLYADRTAKPANIHELFNLLLSQTGEGVVSHEDLKRFSLAKK